MKLESEQLGLDINILVHLIRGKDAGKTLDRDYGLSSRRPRCVIPIVVKGEILSFARNIGWGAEKLATLNLLIQSLPVVDINSADVLSAYGELDDLSRRQGSKMGKNDVWIAAIARVQQGVILTTDQDFAHLHPAHVRVEYVDPATLEAAS